MFEVKPMSVKDETAAGKDESSQCDGGVRMCGDDLLYQYETQDWIISPEEPSAISPMLAEETFRYMTLLAAGSSYPHKGSKVLSADRVEQMTKTYNDIEVVTHLLSERDRDLELAARIGQSLLQRNHVLQERNDSLEEQLAQAVDRIHQLQHELVKKDELFRMVASEESETDSSCSTPLRKVFSTGGSLPLGELNALQMKLQELEDENLSLRSEACQLKKDTSTYEEKEQQLVHDCVQELRESNSQMVSLTNELSQKSEDLLRHQEEIAQLLSQIVQLQHRLKELALEKEELRIHLQASKEAQRQLTAELKELTDRNAECVGMLHESQDEIKELRSKSSPSAGLRRQSYRLHPMDSLAAEIEGTMRKELSVDEERAFQDQRSAQKRVFQTVQCVKQVKAAHTVPPIPGSASNAIIMTPVAFRSHTPNTEDQSEDPSHLGQPGSPGGSDLTSALHRLSLRRQNFLCERQFFQAERDRKLHELEAAESEKAGSGCSSPMGSAVSSFSNLSEFSLSSSYFKTFLPEKLQIVKPMEGSLTLHHWQQLAKPHLASVLDPHPGVVTKGFQPLPQDAIYHLTDLEEDEENAPWVMEKPQNEQKNDEVEDEEEGITFHVRLFSTPVKNESRPMSSLPASLRNSPVSIATTVTVPASNTSLSVTVPATITSTTVTVPATITSTTVASPAVSSAQLHLNLSSSTGVNPGKYQSSTFSTYTFTTCRILHPTDSTQVTPSSACSTTASANTPSSLRTGPSTPVTPCLLSLGDSFPVRRPAAPPGGLAKLVLEKGISAQGSTAATGPKKPVCLRRLPSTPPNSPLHSPCPSPVPFESRSTSTDNFLASRPAELFLQDVYGLKLGRASRLDLLSPEQTSQVESASPDSHSSVTLLQHLRKLGLDKKVLRGSKVNSSNSQEAATFLSTGCGSLLDGLRRNQSLPAMVGRRCVSVSSPSFNLPPPHPTSLALPTPTWAGPVTLPESPPIDRTPSGKY